MEQDSLKRAIARAGEFLLASRNSDGGWGYASAKVSCSEPTAYSLLALSGSETGHAFKTLLDDGVRWFRNHTGQGGALSVTTSPGPTDIGTLDNWGTILAFFALRRLTAGGDLTDRYLKYLLGSYGNRIDKKTGDELKLNGDLVAWSWARGTASWVEPTAYAVLALKANSLGTHERVRGGEAFLLDRACYGGGWNYGNKEVLHVVLEPMPTNTCFALLALQDLDRKNEIINQSLAYLEREVAQHQSSLLLALGALCMNAYQRPFGPLTEGLLRRQDADGAWRGNVHLTALGSLALQMALNGRNPFRLDG